MSDLIITCRICQKEVFEMVMAESDDECEFPFYTDACHTCMNIFDLDEEDLEELKMLNLILKLNSNFNY